MDSLEIPKGNDESQPLLSHSRNSEKLKQLRKKHNIPSDRHGAKSQQSPIGHNWTQSDIVEHNQTSHDIAGHRRTQSDLAEYNIAQHNIKKHDLTQKDIIRYSSARPDTIGYGQTQQNIARHNRSWSDTKGSDQIQKAIVGRKGKEPLEDISVSKKNDERLKDLEAKYLLCGEESPPIHRQDSQVEYIIDGVEYFQRVHKLIQSTRKGDAIFISGLSFSSKLDLLLDKPPSDPRHQELGDLLAEKATDGVDVRILLASGSVTSSFPFPKWFPLRRNTLPAMDLRTRIPKRHNVTEAPLARRVALDWTGALLGSNHQKFVLVSHQGKLTALVTGLDFLQSRYDQYPHNTLRIDKKRWGWHDASVLVTGPITESIWENFQLRWQEVKTLPKRSMWGRVLQFGPMNPLLIEVPPDAPKQEDIVNPGVSLQVLRSFGKWKVDSLLPARRKPWSSLPREGIKEIYQCLTKALGSARRYVYIEDAYLREREGGKFAYEIYPFLVEAAKRDVKVILLGSGGIEGGGRLEVDREENATTLPAGEGTSQIEMSTLTNLPSADHDQMPKVRHRVSRDIQKKVLDQLPPEKQRNIVVSHIEHTKIHAKVTLIDDEFASVGSANLFSRSMSGVDHELNVALVTTGTQVRDLRVKLWAEHLRSPLGHDLINALCHEETALGIWRPEWLPQTADRQTWRKRGLPKGFEPIEQVLKLVGPE
jgi:phosphatidylserine/phosphatidylglycerophosphate/cardiolipin synthase-like enzyme